MTDQVRNNSQSSSMQCEYDTHVEHHLLYPISSDNVYESYGFIMYIDSPVECHYHNQHKMFACLQHTLLHSVCISVLRSPDWHLTHAIPTGGHIHYVTSGYSVATIHSHIHE